ncbi:MAG: HNH endonuclease [Acidimicrobiia bacterium]|nr:HNH endonuclease [Acidimicrobiia bacterium]
MLTATDWVERISSLRRWSQRGVRAPHKPLLLLYMIGRFTQTGSRRVTFAEAEPVVADLLDRYGPPVTKATPQYPFHHLQNDEGFWRVSTSDGRPWPETRLSELREVGIGEITEDLAAAITDPAIRATIVGALLEEFGDSYRTDLLEDVGLTESPLALTVVSRTIRRRDPEFRDKVLTAYERRCAFCGFDGRLADRTIGLDAAHVRWHAFEGPDEVANGLALCTIHHKLLDLGVVGLTIDHTIAVSQRFSGSGESAERLVLSLAGADVRGPQSGARPVDEQYVEWHREQVFHGPARVAG